MLNPKEHTILFVDDEENILSSLKGYPDRLKGEEIPLGARIISSANRFDNVLRLYDKKTAVTELKNERGIDLDPEIVNHLLKMVEDVRGEEEGEVEVPHRPYSRLDLYIKR